MHKRFYLVFFFKLFSFNSFCFYNHDTSLISKYHLALSSITEMLALNGEFKNAVLLVENVYNPDIDYRYFNRYIDSVTQILLKHSKTIILKKYRTIDSIDYKLNYSIFYSMYDTMYLSNTISPQKSSRYKYNFTDPQGVQDWTNTFVTKLLSTHKGNCSSLTYLYKIIADGLGAKCWLALAPNHIYIRNYSKQIGWYSTELTSATFPTDAWIAATGYVSTDAIRSGIYMDTLSNQQAIGLCVLGLAQGYLKQTNNYTDGFVLKCCDLALQYHPINPEALLLKAEVLKRTYLNMKEKNQVNAQYAYNQMEDTYITLVKLGYREMPFEKYQKWLKSVDQQKQKYINSKANTYQAD